MGIHNFGRHQQTHLETDSEEGQISPALVIFDIIVPKSKNLTAAALTVNPWIVFSPLKAD